MAHWLVQHKTDQVGILV